MINRAYDVTNWLLYLAACLSILSCDDSETSQVEAGTEQGGMEQAGQVMSGNEGGSDQAGEEVVGGSLTPPSPPSNPIASCDEIGAIACFANEDCQTNARCQNVGTAEIATPCCVAGERGTIPAGQPCDPETGELTCASALCMYGDSASQGICSGTCERDTDCPANLPRCIEIAFSESDSMWCSPAQ